MPYDEPPLKHQFGASGRQRSPRALPRAYPDGRPVSGLTRPYLGRRLSVHEIISRTEWDWTPNAAARVRAFLVAPLMGAVFQTPDQRSVAGALTGLMRERLPGPEWATFRSLEAILARYQMIHGQIAAPPDDTTGEPMALEVYGTVRRCGGVDFEHSSAEEREAWRAAHWARRGPDGDDPPLLGEIAIRIEVATYANVSYLGYGVPLYL